jgi:hypothetical protein
LIDTGLRIYDRDAEVGKGQGLSRSLIFAKMVYDLAAKSDLVYDLIAKIWAESDPVYDLTAIDNDWARGFIVALASTMQHGKNYSSMNCTVR